MMESTPQSSSRPSVGILILNYHHPEVTLSCTKRLLEVEGDHSVILWLENDSQKSVAEAFTILEASGLPWIQLDPEKDALPPPGHIGFISIPDNLGYAGGNNVGLRFLERHQIEFAWIMNNDTLLESGSSEDLVAEAQARPEVGIWGATLRSSDGVRYSGATVLIQDFSMQLLHGDKAIESEPLSYISGCSLFFAVKRAADIGFLPEEYFLYYEDPAFSMEFRRRGFLLSVVPDICVYHMESLSVGRRSSLMEYYSRRNRWYFIQQYFPGELPSQQRKAWYRFQSLIFRGAFRRAWVEWLALTDWRRGCMGRTLRVL